MNVATYIFLRGHRIGAKRALEIAGYKARPYGDYIKEDRFGRFHAYIKTPKAIEVHFDLYVGDTHYVPYAPSYMREERQRIIKALRPWQVGGFDFKRELSKL